MNLTIITVSFNAETVIRNTIESILNQSEAIYEYIFIDGASKDNTISIIEEYRKQFERKGIRFIVRSEPDKGISDAFNKGIRLATGDLIGIINADDEMHDNCVKTLQEVFEKTNADIYYGDCIWQDEKGYVYKKPGHKLNKLLYKMILYHPSTFVRRTTYEKCGVFDISYKYCMDKQFLYRCFKEKKTFYYIDKPLVIFKAGGVSDTHAGEVFREGTRMAIEFGESETKANLIEKKKQIKYQAISMIKGTKMYEEWINRRIHESSRNNK